MQCYCINLHLQINLDTFECEKHVNKVTLIIKWVESDVESAEPLYRRDTSHGAHPID